MKIAFDSISQEMDTIRLIPTEIFKIIQSYLTKSDWRNLLNSNKTIFQNIKEETVYYDLFIDWRKKGANEKFFQITDDLSRFYQSVKDKHHQISLRINSPTEENIQQCSDFFPGIHKLTLRTNNGKCNFWKKSPNMTIFSNIHHLILHYVEGIHHLTGLVGIKILEISISQSIIAIDYIPGLKRLVLDTLNELTDISNYSHIPELMINNCYKLNFKNPGNHNKLSITSHEIDDISIFQNIQYLTINYLSNLLNDNHSHLPIFYHLIHLHLDFSDIKIFNFSYFPNLQFLKLALACIPSNVMFPASLKIAEFSNCSFDDLSVVRHVKQLKFSDCEGEGFNDISVLSNAYTLHFNGMELDDVGSLGRVHDLIIESVVSVKGLSKLGQVHHLELLCYGITSLEGLGQGNSDITLAHIKEKIDFSPLRSVYKVTIEFSDGLVDGSMLSNVQHLTLLKCNCFTNTNALGNVKSLFFINCEGIKRLDGLENVPHVHLEKCDQIEDIDCLGKQQSLIIIQCQRIKQLIEADVSKKYDRIFHGIPLVKIDVKAFSWFSPKSSKLIKEDFFSE